MFGVETAGERGKSRDKKKRQGKRGRVAKEEGVREPEALTGLNTVLGQQIIGA